MSIMNNIVADDNILSQIVNKLKEEREKMHCVNIVIAGKTGVGKSTLINKIFGAELAETGIGRPITQEIKEIYKAGIPVRIYDTVGLELDKKRQKESEHDIVNTIRQNRLDPDKAIHCIWYCVNANSNRIEDAEIEFINDLSDKFGAEIPIVIIITQAYAAANSKQLKNYVDGEIKKGTLRARKSFCLLAQDYAIDENYRKPAYGCEDLVNYLSDNIAETAQKAFVASQKLVLKKKRERAQAVIATTVAGAFATGFSPIPFSDAPILITAQVGMIAGITPIYGANIKKSTINAIVTSMLGSVSATVAGKTIVANLLKFIPLAGDIVGGVISGGTAAALTASMGETYILIMEKLIKGEIKEQDLANKEKMKQFQTEFSKNFKAQLKK